jgi:dipeptidyl aminopeptidase/acylaminoacyl peptidase
MRPIFLLLFTASSLLQPASVIAQSPEVIAPAENLVVDGVPTIPAKLAAEVRRYTESRSAGLADWHPVRREILISTRFGNTAQIHRVATPLGARTQLTFFDEPIGNASYEPTAGRYFLFSRDVGGNEFGQIYRYDLASGAVTLLTDGGRSQNGGRRWNTRGDRIAYGSTRRNGTDRDIYVMDPLNPTSGRLLLEVKGGGWGVSDWSPDDRQLLVGEYLSVNQSRFYLVDASSGNRSLLVPDERDTVAYGNARFSRDGRGVYLTTDAGSEFQRLAYVDLGTRRITPLTVSINWDVEGFELSPDGRTIAFARSPSDVYSLNPRTGTVTRWTESELGGLIASELAEPSLIRWRSFDGREITGFYYRPQARFTGKRPVIINIHGGPEGQYRPGFLGRGNYYLNELGVAVIYPNVRGSTGYGKEFVKLDNGMRREDSVRDIGALLDWIGQQPELDASRVMVTGGSYGGYMTLAVATNYNERICCALDIVGISNFNTFLKNTESYRRDLRRVEYGDERDPQMQAFFERIAPLNNAGKISRPLFVIQGGNDPRVPRTEAEQIVARVKQNGSPVWYLMAKDEGHGFRKKNNVDFQFYSTVEFVRRFLLGAPPTASSR